jgi:hypothetical protein
MNTAITAGVGLTLINSTSFSAQSVINFTGCFSSTYDNYKIFVYITSCSPTGESLNFRMLSGATPVTTATYEFGFAGYTTGGAANNYAGSGQTSGFLLDLSSNAPDISSGEFTFYKPFLANRTTYTGGGFMRYLANEYSRHGGGTQTNQTSYDGIRLLTTGGTATGVVKIYGVKN